jgi:hypothetical protein
MAARTIPDGPPLGRSPRKALIVVRGTRPVALVDPVVRVATRQWLYVKCMPPETRGELATQGLLWTGLLFVLVCGVAGLAPTPLG